MKSLTTKLTTIGDSGVGKSSLLLQFTEQTFQENLPNTIGMDFFSRIFEFRNYEINYRLYDTAGQEKYKSMAPLYYHDAKIILVIFDVTNKTSFENLTSWLDEVRAKAPPDAIKYLIGNKIDLIDIQVVELSDVQQLAENYENVFFRFVSAKTNQGINELFEEISERLISSEAKPVDRNIRLKSSAHDERNEKENSVKKQKKCDC